MTIDSVVIFINDDERRWQYSINNIELTLTEYLNYITYYNLLQEIKKEKMGFAWTASRKNNYLVLSKIIRDSFMSGLTVHTPEKGKEYGLVFQVLNQRFRIDDLTGRRTNVPKIVLAESNAGIHEQEGSTGAFTIGYVNYITAKYSTERGRRRLEKERVVYDSLRVLDFGLAISEKILDVKLKARSNNGLMKVAIEINGLWNEKKGRGRDLVSHRVRIPYEGDCITFGAMAQDIYGNEVYEKIPFYVYNRDVPSKDPFIKYWVQSPECEEQWKLVPYYFRNMKRKKTLNTIQKFLPGPSKMLLAPLYGDL
jgi:hypothetical protein